MTTEVENAHRYNAALAQKIEERWQKKWDEAAVYRTPNPGEADFDPSRPKFYCLDMFPYPSGAGLHVGHPEGYTATDIICRYKRMRGFNVLHPMGWDAFGLPAEQYAISTGVHPAITTKKAIDNFRRQLKRFGFCYDWSREFATIDEEYYRWTQWIWLQAYESHYDRIENRARPIALLIDELERGVRVLSDENEPVLPGTTRGSERPWSVLDERARRDFIDAQRLAYLGEQTVNWCPKLGTALANEEVIDGRSERGGHPVLRKPLKQWMFRITAYAERLLRDLDHLDWPESTRTMQREWIGRSEGAEIDFPVIAPPAGAPGHLRVYTTRPDTVFGVTYMVIAPEHPLVEHLLRTPPRDADVAAIREYVAAAKNRADVDRMADAKTKTGVFSGLLARNPATGQTVPIWIADYVLMGYGHGAIMAVPAHDQRDYEFAQAFNLPIRDVVYGLVFRTIRACAERLRLAQTPRDEVLSIMVDFVGICMTHNRHDYDAVWGVVTGRRRSQPQLDASGQERRGSISRIWHETLVELMARTVEDFTSVVLEGRLAEIFGAAITEPGQNVNSAGPEFSLDGLSTDDAKARTVQWLESSRQGRHRVNFKLRDWLFSRQRYWGEPFPIVFDESGRHYPVQVDHLPVRLPAMADYAPVESEDPQPLLAKAHDWIQTTAGAAGVSPSLLPPSTPVRREANTMPGWAGSCWYYLRYCDPKCDDRLVSRAAERYWLLSGRKGATEDPFQYGTFMPDLHHLGGVDLYVGGSEHAVLHLLYARFWHKILFDLGEVSTPEPFGRLFHQGLITAYAYQRRDKTLVAVDMVDEVSEGRFVENATNEVVTPVVAKMSKSLKNVVNPDDVIAEYGADTFRLYEMAMGPLEASKPWNTQDISGVYRFLQRAWRLAIDEQTGKASLRESADPVVERALNRMIAKVGEDIERLGFNTAIAAMIEFVNEATKSGGLTRDQLDRFTRVLGPFAPHAAEELRHRAGISGSVVTAPWPSFDPAALRDATIELPIQILGKVKARITVPADADVESIRAAALADEKVQAQLAGKTVKNVIVVPGKIINVIAS